MADRVLESQLEHFLMTRVRLLGGHSIKLAPIEAGTPDRLVMLPGGYMSLVELKAEGGRVSPIQKLWHERAAAMGITVYVLTGKAEILEWLRLERDDAYHRDKQLKAFAAQADVD